MIKDVLVHVDSTQGGKARLEYTFGLAACCGAQLTGVHVLAPVDVPPYFKPHAVERVYQNLAQLARDDARASETLFGEAVAAHETPSRWRSLEGHMSERICEQARCADLVVLGQYEAEGVPERRPLYLAEEVVLRAGRPVLVVPESWTGSFRCRRVLVGWDASREAARAVHDALPLLVQTGPRVEILSLEEPGRTVVPSELADHLNRHGVKVAVSRQFRARTSHGDALVKELNAAEFDLLVMGAYGHPIWLQLLFGGVTSSVLSHAPSPVMLSC